MAGTGGGSFDVIVVGGGVAGLSAGLFMSRQGLDTCVLDAGESMLRMNAHLENYPGFPEGVNPRLLLDLFEQHARNNGCELREAVVGDVDPHPEGGYVLSTVESSKFNYRTDYLIGASAGNVEYLRNLDVEVVEQEHGAYVESDEKGRTSLEGLYVAGGLANKPLQAVISAGHGAEVAVTLLEDSDVSFAHDWTVPEGFFTERGQEVLSGSEEIDAEQRDQRETQSLRSMQENLEEPFPEDVVLPPGVGS